MDSPCVRHTSQPCCHGPQDGPVYRGCLCCGMHTHEAIHANVSTENAVKCYTVLAKNHMASHQHLRHTGHCLYPHRDIPMQVRYTQLPFRSRHGFQADFVLPKCRPPQDYWKITLTPDSNCINQTWSLLVAGVVNALTDLIAVLLPIRTVWTLQLPPRQVAIVVLLFSLGFVSCIAGIIRTYFMYRVTKEFDQTWNSYPVWITSAVELYIGMVRLPSKPQTFHLCPS